MHEEVGAGLGQRPVARGVITGRSHHREEPKRSSLRNRSLWAAPHPPADDVVVEAVAFPSVRGALGCPERNEGTGENSLNGSKGGCRRRDRQRHLGRGRRWQLHGVAVKPSLLAATNRRAEQCQVGLEIAHVERASLEPRVA